MFSLHVSCISWSTSMFKQNGIYWTTLFFKKCYLSGNLVGQNVKYLITILCELNKICWLPCLDKMPSIWLFSIIMILSILAWSWADFCLFLLALIPLLWRSLFLNFTRSTMGINFPSPSLYKNGCTSFLILSSTSVGDKNQPTKVTCYFMSKS